MPFVSANAIAIHRRLSGRRGAPRLVFLNSLGSDLRIWEGVAAALEDRFEILCFDMRGHGLSEATPGPITIGQLADDLLGLLDAVGWHAASLVGLSIGGLIASHVAIHAPDRVERLVLLDTAARIGTPESWDARIAAVRDGGLGAISETVLAGWVTEAFRTLHPQRFAAWRSMLEATPVEGYLAACAALREADLSGEVGRITAPTLALAGEDDRATPPGLVRATADRIPGARFALIRGAAHLPCLERPDELAALIADHMREGERAGDERFAAGMAVRRQVLGDAHVERASAAATPFDAPFQRFITEGAWGSVWSRPHFALRERSIVTIALLAALGQDEELAMHVRATHNTGATADDIAEALLHVAVYAGVPAANHAIKIAKATLADREETVR